jgi:type VI protein secretion system component VasK
MTALGGSISAAGSLRRYPAARDWWATLLIWGTVLVTVWAGAKILGATGETPVTSVFLLVLVLAVAFLLWVLYGTWYELDHRELRARCGPFTTNIALDRIGAIVRSRNPASSMALSLDRLAVLDRGGRLLVLISPRDRDAFLRDVAWLGPGLEYRDGEVRRMARARG